VNSCGVGYADGFCGEAPQQILPYVDGFKRHRIKKLFPTPEHTRFQAFCKRLDRKLLILASLGFRKIKKIKKI